MKHFLWHFSHSQPEVHVQNIPLRFLPATATSFWKWSQGSATASEVEPERKLDLFRGVSKSL
jgi:hypothetical protein